VGVGLDTEVWRADDTVHGREVAVKLYAERLGTDRPFVHRFVRNMRAVSKLDHSNVQPVYDAGSHLDWTYLVGPYVVGGSLQARLTGRPWQLAEAVQLLAGLATGLDHIHQQHLVHRNLKPSNVLLDGARPILCDFLVHRPFDPTNDLGQFGHLALAPAYAAPEQVAGDSTPSSHLSDLYSFGVLAYQLLTGRPPFTNESPVRLLFEQIATPPPPARGLNPDLPAAVEQVLATMLAKDPARRFASATAFVRALRYAASPPKPTQRVYSGPMLSGSTLHFQATQLGVGRVQRWRQL
jgi:serine/threonine-protein kinase